MKVKQVNDSEMIARKRESTQSKERRNEDAKDGRRTSLNLG